MNYKEMKQIVNMLYEEWDLGRKSSRAKGKICAWIYLCEIMEETEQIIIEKENNMVIGICGYSKWGSKKHLLRKLFYKLLKNILINSPSIENKKAIYEYNKTYSYLPEELEGYFDGEISILIVDKKYRGKNYGKELLLNIFDLAKKDNIHKLQILSDESCDFEFYEKLGCKKIYEKHIDGGEPNKCGEQGFIYEKVL